MARAPVPPVSPLCLHPQQRTLTTSVCTGNGASGELASCIPVLLNSQRTAAQHGPARESGSDCAPH